MKKTFTTTFIIFALLFSFASQGQNTAVKHRCGTIDQFSDYAGNDSPLFDQRRQFEKAMEQFNNNSTPTTPARLVPRVIPVVVHVLHQCGAENITKEQIVDGIRVLNEDFRRLNADTTDTPAGFRPVAADCNIEFRLAQLDPNGNCTEGIVRVESNRTAYWNPRDSLKRVSYWPTDEYLNIWLVNGIYDQNGLGLGEIAGYAHWPWDTIHQGIVDGVVINHRFFGSIGTAVSSGNDGRVASHEVGHWMGLLHIWGDDASHPGGVCAGSDNCGDTPNQADLTFGCPNFPLHDVCTGGGNGVMFMNYMDYTDGICQNMFTNGQKGRMDQVFNLYRSNIISAANLTNTGTDGTPPVTCAPIVSSCSEALFLCAGDSVALSNFTYNADTITYSWSFPGGTPAASFDESPIITYLTPGVYGYSMVATSSGGTDSIQVNNFVTVSGPATIKPVVSPTVEDYELALSFPGDGFVVNPDNGITWQRVTGTGFSGVASLKISNYTNTQLAVDQYITPSFDVDSLSGITFKFRVAHAQRSSTSADILKVYTSKDCGQSWTERYSKSGSGLATAGIIASNFTPTLASQWRLETVIPSLGTPPPNNVRFMFENISDRGNNTYIDDISINFLGITLGVKETEFESSGFRIYPNPASDIAAVTYNLASTGEVSLSILDLLGREVKQIVHGKVEQGLHLVNVDVQSLSKGLYLMNLHTPHSVLTTKFIVE